MTNDPCKPTFVSCFTLLSMSMNGFIFPVFDLFDMVKLEGEPPLIFGKLISVGSYLIGVGFEE